MMHRRTLFGMLGALFIPKLATSSIKQQPYRSWNLMPFPKIGECNVELFYLDKITPRLEFTLRLQNNSLWAIHTDLKDTSQSEMDMAYTKLMNAKANKKGIPYPLEFRYSKNIDRTIYHWIER